MYSLVFILKYEIVHGLLHGLVQVFGIFIQ